MVNSQGWFLYSVPVFAIRRCTDYTDGNTKTAKETESAHDDLPEIRLPWVCWITSKRGHSSATSEGDCTPPVLGSQLEIEDISFRLVDLSTLGRLCSAQLRRTGNSLPSTHPLDAYCAETSSVPIILYRTVLSFVSRPIFSGHPRFLPLVLAGTARWESRLRAGGTAGVKSSGE